MNKFIYIICLALTLGACDDWLDISPKTNVDEADLFDKEQGFKEALTGVYIKMSDQSLYGRELTYGFMDILAQRYANPQNQNADYDDPTVWYTYPSTRTEGYTKTFWSSHYNLIANLNNLLANIEERGENIKTEGLRDIIEGEALGLRAYLYLDLLRMFGPIYKDNASSPSIPYRTEFNRDVVKLSPASVVIDKIIDDLKNAETLLENDPMNIVFNSSYVPTGFLSNRFNRMNKFAVKAAMARAYLWKGDKVNAAAKAQEVIDGKNANGGNMFSLITDNMQDKLGSTELIFALNMDSETFADVVENDFFISSWSYYVLMDLDKLYAIFDTQSDGMNDMRYKEGAGFSVSSAGAYTLKYSQEGLISPALLNTMPLIRLPEMYYILAECTDDLDEASALISTVREARGIENVTFANETERMNHIEKEYRKEFYAEGQLWYFYKRLGYETFLYCPVEKMVEANYRFAIPDDETILGNIN